MFDAYTRADVGDTVGFTVADIGRVRGEVVFVEALPTGTDMDVETASARWTLQSDADGANLNAVLVDQAASDHDKSGGAVTDFDIV